MHVDPSGPRAYRIQIDADRAASDADVGNGILWRLDQDHDLIRIEAVGDIGQEVEVAFALELQGEPFGGQPYRPR